MSKKGLIKKSQVLMLEDYKKKYEDMFDRLNNLIDNTKKDGFTIARLEDIESAFPELEDRRMIKLLKDIIYTSGERYILDNFHVRSQDLTDWIDGLRTKQEIEEEIERAYKNSDEVQYKQGYIKALKDCAKEFGDKYNDAFEANHKNHIYKPTISYNDTLSILEKLEKEINTK